MSELPGNPLSIELTVSHRRLFWHTDDEDDYPEHWTASADVFRLGECVEPARHVADVEFLIADLTAERNLLDSVSVGEWALEFLAETVLDPSGRLHPELGAEIGAGPARMIILRHLTVAQCWRGHGLASALIAGVLRILAPSARLAVCRISPLDFGHTYPDRVSAELASVRAGLLLERIGFRRWREAHVVDLKSPRLLDARMDLLNRWWPHADDGA
ncbi:GNAT family N-acetyltransferase [Amycolatopsis alkalitolerans]|uniref:GNAT family N-acetyltransferase n=1 Tax=Amycolatopsis alkalitolerans TaxID=2547244 RepID=A0A5C4LVX6_9PSEU|nr:hypothetical protein [Amycolatopsis alkalitolerans]TNC22230.1 hypothetical protein FG385_25995 [Amycolatopsis alkalitolerans]